MTGTRKGKSAPKDKIKCCTCDLVVSESPKSYEEKSIECECCLKWYHNICQQLEEPKYNAITEFNLHWYCLNCDGAASKLYLHCTNLQSEQVKIKEDIKSLKDSLGKTQMTLMR